MLVSHKKSEVVPEFEPIEIRLVVQSAKELCDLWLRHNLSGSSVDKENGSYLIHTSQELDDDPNYEAKFWKLLDNLIHDRNLKPVR